MLWEGMAQVTISVTSSERSSSNVLLRDPAGREECMGEQGNLDLFLCRSWIPRPLIESRYFARHKS